MDKNISTFEQDTGATSVLATSHVTVSVVEAFQTIPVAEGYKTINGPEFASVETVTSAKSLQPITPSGLSRTDNLKSMVRVTVGTTSHVNGPPEASEAKLGK